MNIYAFTVSASQKWEKKEKETKKMPPNFDDGLKVEHYLHKDG